jgi:hypothetical protein
MSAAASRDGSLRPDRLVERSPELALRNISKRFGAIVALDDVGLEVNRGEVDFDQVHKRRVSSRFRRY